VVRKAPRRHTRFISPEFRQPARVAIGVSSRRVPGELLSTKTQQVLRSFSGHSGTVVQNTYLRKPRSEGQGPDTPSFSASGTWADAAFWRLSSSRVTPTAGRTVPEISVAAARSDLAFKDSPWLPLKRTTGCRRNEDRLHDLLGLMWSADAPQRHGMNQVMCRVTRAAKAPSNGLHKTAAVTGCHRTGSIKR